MRFLTKFGVRQKIINIYRGIIIPNKFHVALSVVLISMSLISLGVIIKAENVKKEALKQEQESRNDSTTARTQGGNETIIVGTAQEVNTINDLNETARNNPGTKVCDSTGQCLVADESGNTYGPGYYEDVLGKPLEGEIKMPYYKDAVEEDSNSSNTKTGTGGKTNDTTPFDPNSYTTTNSCYQQDNSCTVQGCMPKSTGNTCRPCDCTVRIDPVTLPKPEGYYGSPTPTPIKPTAGANKATNNPTNTPSNNMPENNTSCPDSGNRNDCDAIRGTDYCSTSERTYYLANCLTTTPTPQPQPTTPSQKPLLADPHTAAKNNPHTEYCTSDGQYCYVYDGKKIHYTHVYNALNDPGKEYCGHTKGGFYCMIADGIVPIEDYMYDALNNPGKEYCDVHGERCTISDGKFWKDAHIVKALRDPGQEYCPKGNPFIYGCRISDGKNLYTLDEYKKKFGINPTGFMSAPSESKKITPVSASNVTTQEPSEARTNLVVFTAGIGTNTASGQNPNPARPQEVQIQILDLSGNVIKEGRSPFLAKELENVSLSGLGYQELFSLGNIPRGTYTTRIRLDNTLWKTAESNFTPGQTTSIPPIELILGDIDQDNTISLLDYNILISCLHGKTCEYSAQADLNLDGKVDELDINLLLASFSTRQGD